MFPNWQQIQQGFPVQQPMFGTSVNHQQMYNWFQHQQPWPVVPPGGALPQTGPNPPLPTEGSKPPLPVNPAPPSDDDKPPLPPEPPPDEKEDLAPKSQEELAKLSQLQQQAAQWQQQKHQPWGQQWGMRLGMGQAIQQQDSGPVKQMFDAILQEEKDFAEQYKQWKQQYEDWKKQNENHPNKDQFHQYEQQWRTYEKQMEDKQTDILQRKKDLQEQMTAAEQSMMNQQGMMNQPKSQIGPGEQNKGQFYPAGSFGPGGPNQVSGGPIHGGPGFQQQAQFDPRGPSQGQIRASGPMHGQLRPGGGMRPGMEINRMQGPRGPGQGQLRGQRPQFEPRDPGGGNRYRNPFLMQGHGGMGEEQGTDDMSAGDDMELDDENGEQEGGSVGGNFSNFGPQGGKQLGGQNRFNAPGQYRFNAPRDINTPVPNNPFRRNNLNTPVPNNPFRRGGMARGASNIGGEKPKPLMSLTFDDTEEDHYPQENYEEYGEEEYHEDYQQNQMFGGGQNQMFGSGPRFGPRGGNMGNQRPRFGMRGGQSQNHRFGFPGNQHGNRFQNSNIMQSPFGMQEGNNDSQRETNLQQSWLQKHLQGPQNAPQHPLPGSKGSIAIQSEKPKQAGTGELPNSKASEDEAGDGNSEGLRSQEIITEEIISLQKQQEMLNELKKYEKGPQNPEVKVESKPGGQTSQNKDGQDKSQSQSPVKKDVSGLQSSQNTATPAKEGVKAAPPTSQSSETQQKTLTSNQDLKPPTPNQQVVQPQTPNQGSKPPTLGQVSAMPPGPNQVGQKPPGPSQQAQQPTGQNQQGQRPPGPGQQGKRPPDPNQQGQRPPGPNQQGQRPQGPNLQGQRPPGPNLQGQRQPGPYKQGQKPSGTNQQGQRPSGPNQRGQRPPGPNQGQRPLCPSQQGQRTPGPNQQGQRPPGPNQQGHRPPGPNQQGHRPPGPNQSVQRPTGLNQADQRPTGPNQAGQRPPGPNQAGQRPPGPRQFGQRSEGPNQFGQRQPGSNQSGSRFLAPNQQGQRFLDPNQQGNISQSYDHFGQRSFGQDQGPRGPRPSHEEQGYVESEYYQDQEQEEQGPDDWKWKEEASYDDNERQRWGNRGRGGRGCGRGNDRGRGRGRGGWQAFQEEDKSYQEEESQQEDWIHDNPYLQEEFEHDKGMEEEGERYMDALKESDHGPERDYSRGHADYRREDPYQDPFDKGYDRYGRRSPLPHDPYSRVPPLDPYSRAPPPYYDRRDPYDRYDPYRRPDQYARHPDPYEYDRRPYYDPYRPPVYDYGRDYRYADRYPPPVEDKPYQKPEVIDHGHKPTEFSSGRESSVPYVAPQTVIDYGHGKQEERELERPPNSLDKDRDRFRELPISYGSPGRDVRSRQVVHEARIETVKVDDLLIPPGRKSRPTQIVVILRGPPGAGKTYVGKLVKDKEVQHGGGAPRMLCLDDYFMVEQEKSERDPETGKKVKKKVLEYEYEPEMESSYRQNMFKSFKKTVDDGFFPFIIVDAVNDKVQHFEEFWSYAKSKGFQVYVAEIDAEAAICSKRNTHKRSLKEIEKIKSSWEETPKHYLRLDIRALLQEDSITEVEMEDEVEKNSDKRKKEESDDEDDLDENRFGGVYKKSKWEVEGSEKNLDKLDGLVHSKRKRTPSPVSIDDFLRDEMSRPLLPGQKRVRWADLEERKMQYRMREIGFVVGQTQRDWERITDDSFADRQLNRTKYI